MSRATLVIHDVIVRYFAYYAGIMLYAFVCLLCSLLFRHNIRMPISSSALRDEVLHKLHAGALEGHLGEEKTLNKVKEHFYWPGMQHDVRNWCRTCEACQTRKSAPKKNYAPLQTIKAGYPMQVVAVDIMGPLRESETGNKYVLVASDYFTKCRVLPRK